MYTRSNPGSTAEIFTIACSQLGKQLPNAAPKMVRAVAAEPRMMCLSAPTVVAQADRDALLPLLQGKALAGASEAVGEIAILD